ncbi:hypothetical protein Avbf_06081, partial [Armadillidium vulgare]
MTLFFLFIKSQNFSEETKRSKHFVAEGQGLSILVLIFLNLVEDSRAANMAKFLESSLLILTGIRLFQEYWQYEYSVLYYYLKKLVQLNILFILMVFILNQSYQFYGLSLVATYVIYCLLHCTRNTNHSLKPKILLLICGLNYGRERNTVYCWVYLWDVSVSFSLTSPKYLKVPSVLENFQNTSKFFLVASSSLLLFITRSIYSRVFTWRLNSNLYIYGSIFVFMVSRWLLLKFKSIYFPRLEVLGDSWIEVYILHFHVFL